MYDVHLKKSSYKKMKKMKMMIMKRHLTSKFHLQSHNFSFSLFATTNGHFGGEEHIASQSLYASPHHSKGQQCNQFYVQKDDIAGFTKCLRNCQRVLI